MRRATILLLLIPLLPACTFLTKQQGTMGVRFTGGTFAVELFHETPDTDEASISLQFDKNLWQYIGIADSDGDGVADQSVEPVPVPEPETATNLGPGPEVGPGGEDETPS